MTKEKTHSTRLQDLFRVVNRVVMQKIEEEILKANLEMLHLDSAENFLPSLSREKKEDVLCISGIICHQLIEKLGSIPPCKTIKIFASKIVDNH